MRKKYMKLFLISGIVVILDQVSKAMVARFIPLHHSIDVIPGFFKLSYVFNPGGAFGFMADQSAVFRGVLFIFVTIVAIIMIIYFYKSTPRTLPWLESGLALILGGAVGNLIDRIRFGKVVDFLDFNLFFMQWPAFNIADTAVTLGIGIFALHVLFKKMPE